MGFTSSTPSHRALARDWERMEWLCLCDIDAPLLLLLSSPPLLALHLPHHRSCGEEVQFPAPTPQVCGTWFLMTGWDRLLNK